MSRTPARFDPEQPDVPSLGLPPDPLPDDHEGSAPVREELDEGREDG